MTHQDFISAVKKLGLKESDYIIIGSGILGVLNIREVDDVDLIVSEEVFRGFESTGEWRRKDFEDGTYYLVKGDYELGLDWDSKDASPNLADLKRTQIIVDGIPFVSLDRLRGWKLWKGTPKHLSDIELIDTYLKEHK